MKRMPNGGYTIIEVMIFLVISSALLISASALISGRAERTRFINSVTSFEQKIKDTLNDVSTGYYPSNNGIKCISTGAIVTVTNVASEQGTNSCIYLGKAIEFVTPGTQYNAYTMAAAKDATSLANAGTKLLGYNGVPGISSQYSVDADVEIVKALSIADNRLINGIGIVSEFSQKNGVSDAVTGNATRVGLYEIVDDFNTAGISSMRVSTKGIRLCMQQVNNGKKAVVSIGADGQQLETDSDLSGNWPAGC